MNRRLKAIYAFAAILLLLVFAVILPLCRRGKTGGVRIAVCDGRTDEPLPNAAVVIPETGRTYRLNARAQTGVITVPVRADGRFDGILKRDWGEISLFVYCEGYYPLALFSLSVRADETREELTLYLFEDDGSLLEPFVLTEGPDTEWVRQLLATYAP